METVNQLAARFSVSPQTVRTWCAEFSAYLSPLATPAAGNARMFSPEDLAVLALVAGMRQQRFKYEAIHQALAAGDRAEAPRPQEDSDQPEQDRSLVTRLTATVAKFEGELNAVKAERDWLRQQLADERAARIDAETRAARAEVKPPPEAPPMPLETATAAPPASTIPDPPKQPPRPWWAFWRS